MSDNATIGRAPRNREHPYVQIVRQTLQDSGISFEASGMLCELLSRPDDWKVKVSQLRHRGDGKDRVYRILNELITAGYILRIDGRNNKGHLTTHYLVYETVQDASEAEPVRKIPTGSEKPDTEKPDTENTDTTYKIVGQITESQKEPVDANASTSGDSSVTTLPKQKVPKKAKPKTVIPRSELSEPDALYETVERQLFDTESLPDAPYLWDMPIGQITRWLKGEIEKVRGAVVGKISASAQPHHIALFTAWYRGKYSDAAYPQEFSKFVKHWRAFASEQNRVRTALESRKQREAAAEPIVDEPPMTDEERQRILERGRAMLSGRAKRD